MQEVHVWITWLRLTRNCADTQVPQVTTGSATHHCSCLRTVRPHWRNHSKCQPKIGHRVFWMTHGRALPTPWNPLAKPLASWGVFRVIFSAGFAVSVSSVERPRFSSAKVLQSSAKIFHFQVLTFSRKAKYYVRNKYPSETFHYNKTSIFCWKAVQQDKEKSFLMVSR